MSPCPNAADLAITIAGFALLATFIAGMVGHGVLCPLLEARGITPWKLRDSLGSLPLVLLGSGLMGGTAALLAAWGVTRCSVALWAIVTAIAVVVCGALVMRLGLLALRKLV